ncbi:hypothetical protein IOX91_003196 [Salmonella enterica]|nr:hypothetical protein [Salmonella enterica]
MNTRKSPEEIRNIIDRIKDVPGIPEWMLDKNKYDADEKLTAEEMFEFAEFHTKQLRVNAALDYINYCADRFGFGENGERIFCAPGLLIEIDQNVIETLLIYQIERYVMEEKPEEKYLAPMRFYQGDEINRKENGSTWLFDFIDSVFIDGAKELENVFNDCDKTMH